MQSSSKGKRKKASKKTWTEQLAVEAREQEKAALEKLQNRTNYLKNPRFDESGAQLLTESAKTQAKEINIKKSNADIKPLKQTQVTETSMHVLGVICFCCN